MLAALLGDPVISTAIPPMAMIVIAGVTLIVCANTRRLWLKWTWISLAATAAVAGPAAMVVINPAPETLTRVVAGAIGVFVQIAVILVLLWVSERTKFGSALMIVALLVGAPSLGLMRTAPTATGALAIGLLWVVITGGRGVWRRKVVPGQSDAVMQSPGSPG